jgi:hypothetical protein
MFCEDEVLEAAAWAVLLHEIDHNKEKRKKPRKKTRYKNADKSATPNHFLLHTVLKVFGRLIVKIFTYKFRRYCSFNESISFT